jgi:nucleoid DNA-binding protein
VENNKNMQTMDTNKNSSDDRGEILVNFQTKRKPRFKPGSELSDKVNKANIIFDDFSDEKNENFKVTIELICESGEKIYYTGRSKRKPRFKAGSELADKVNLMLNNEPIEMKANKIKTRFKAGADLTEKVNLVEVEVIQEIVNEKYSFEINVKIT